jgi:class 3 adenylate cyclase
MIDHPQRPRARFPAALELAITASLRAQVERMGAVIGYAQAACGADIIFLEILQALRMQTHVILPFAKADFIQTSVAFAGGDWPQRFERVLERATTVTLATEEAYLGDDVLFEHAANLIHGMAILRAAELATESVQLTVREPGSEVLVGGAEAVARKWTERGSVVENIDMAAIRDAAALPPQAITRPTATIPRASTHTPRELKTLLFADISGFTALPEQYTPDFVQLYLGIGKSIIDTLEHPPIYVSTRGDGLYMVFNRSAHAAEFALQLQEALRTVNWPALGLAQETSARIGLHTGPVFATFDPIMEETTYYGTHVNLTARLEPVVQRGQVFVTEAFAASLTSEGTAGFRCNYIGAMSLARRFSDARLYRLQRSRQPGARRSDKMRDSTPGNGPKT